jgi:hypothetical protein
MRSQGQQKAKFVFADEFVLSGFVIGVVTNVTKARAEGNIGNTVFMEYSVNVTFWQDAIQ